MFLLTQLSWLRVTLTDVMRASLHYDDDFYCYGEIITIGMGCHLWYDSANSWDGTDVGILDMYSVVDIPHLELQILSTNYGLWVHYHEKSLCLDQVHSHSCKYCFTTEQWSFLVFTLLGHTTDSKISGQIGALTLHYPLHYLENEPLVQM